MLIALLNQKGGVGKTTLAVHLVDFLLRQGANVAAIDADGQGAMATWLQQACPKVHVTRTTDAEQTSRAIGVLSAHVDALVADSPPGLDPKGLVLIEHADLIILPIGPSALDLRASRQAIKAIDKVNADADVKVVLNRQQPGTNQSRQCRDAVLEAFGFTAKSVVHLRACFAEAAMAGTVVGRMERNKLAAAAAAEIDQLFTEIIHGDWEKRHAGGDGTGDRAAGGSAAQPRGEDGGEAGGTAGEARRQEEAA